MLRVEHELASDRRKCTAARRARAAPHL